MSKRAVIKQVLGLAAPIAEKLDLELVDVELTNERGQLILRVLIDREGGIGLNDCEALSRILGDELDRLDPIPQNYNLEVSSAGLERPLKKESDYVRFSGRTVRIRLFGALDGRKNFSGILCGFENGQILLEDEQSVVFRIPLTQVAKANLVYIPKSI